MTKGNISVKFLIHLVGERPALWDKTSEEYKDRLLKETSWREICTFINENYERMQPKAKTEFTRMIMRKWTHIRDSWVKSMKYGYDEITKRPPKPYIYHNEMKFMQKILKCKPPRYDFNRPQISNMNFKEFFREKNETEHSQNNVSNGSQAKDAEACEEVEENETVVVNLKHEQNNNESDNHHDEADEEDEDDWPLEDHEETTNIMNEKEEEHDELPAVKKTRSSIFKSSRDEEDSRKQIRYDRIKEYEKFMEQGKTMEQTKHNANNIRSYLSQMKINSYLHENRHWNFFKGILPSLEGLNEDHVLQFQSGVIMLLQKLRESQKCEPNLIFNSNPVPSHSLLRGRARKRKASNDEDYFWPIQNVEVVENKIRRSTRHRTDPIAAAEDMATESDYCSEN
ncbi:uncharacterized protein ACRADG_002600 [Cochliomyia hominivorax]